MKHTNRLRNKREIDSLVKGLAANFSIYKRPVQTADDDVIIPTQPDCDDLLARIEKMKAQ